MGKVLEVQGGYEFPRDVWKIENRGFRRVAGDGSEVEGETRG